MEHRRTFDSSTSSLNSSIVSNTHLNQLDNLQYTTLSSSISPAAGMIASNSYEGQTASTPVEDTHRELRATTLGTVVVRCGPIQLVIALLQSPDKLYIKVVEVEPKITTLGATLDESLKLQRDHDEALRNVQNLPGPMEEFVEKADKLLASKRISSEIVNALADTLNTIWQDVLHLLNDRQLILHLCTQFQKEMEKCKVLMDRLEVACVETMVPIEVQAIQEFLNHFKQYRIDMLTAVMAALKDGNELLAKLQELSKMETLDTRPEHIKRDALRSMHQVQQWLEALHDRRNSLETAWQTRKMQMEQCLTLAFLSRDLNEVEAVLAQKRIEVGNMFSLGECEHTANLALQNYRELKQQALILRDRALKITRAKEKLQTSGAFSGDEACARAYNVLSSCTEHLDLIDQREHWLQQSREFFAKAENTLAVLDKIEIELSNNKTPSKTLEGMGLDSKIERDVQALTNESLRLGYSLLDEVGRTQPETRGVKRVLDEIENRKAYIDSICAVNNEDQLRVERALTEFHQHYNDLLTWLTTSGQIYLQQHTNMGQNLQQSKQFLLQHHELMQELEIKGELINLLLESIKTHLKSLSPQQRYDIDTKAEALHKRWIELKSLVLRRVDGVSVLIEFFEKANEFTSQLDNIERQLLQTPDNQKLQFLKETWANIRNDYMDLKKFGRRFIDMKIVDPYLDVKSSTNAVEDILDRFSKRQIDVTTSLENWTTHIAEKREVEIVLEKIMSENEETAAKTTKVDTQLYPVFTTPELDAVRLQKQLRDKLSFVMKDIEQAQNEIEQRVHTTLGIETSDQESVQKIELVIGNLRTLKSKLDGIKFDYKALMDSIESFLSKIIELHQCIDDYFKNPQNSVQFTANDANGDGVQRIIVEHEKFRNSCMDKFRSLIAQSELLIDHVRVLEPPGAREIDTDRILKLIENLRIYFETNNSQKMSNLDRLERLEQFRTDIDDINRSLDSVSKQLHDINSQSVDSLAAAKTTSLAFEYFERTIEFLEKRIQKFTENTQQNLLITNPESQAYVHDELHKLKDKWNSFKNQVQEKRNSLNHATEFFEKIEKIDAEYREISYFYNSVTSKIPFLRDPVEAGNLVNDIEKYVGSREKPLLDKLNSATNNTYDMNKVSTLYNEVTSIFQSFSKLRSDISIVQERLKNEERMRQQREREAREQIEREKAAREAEANERIAREEELRLQVLQEQAKRDQMERERAALVLAERERAIKAEEARLQATRTEEMRLQAMREEEARLLEARLEALREQTIRQEAAQLEVQRLEQIKREEEARLQALREERTTKEEQTRYELQRLEQLKRDEEVRLQTMRDLAEREEKVRTENVKREQETNLQALRDQVDNQRVVTESIRRDIQINKIFTEVKYASPRFTQLLKNAICREGDKVTFECEVIGQPEPVVEWFKDGISIQGNPDYKTTYNKGLCQLVIEETLAADSARFSCCASNIVGNAETAASLSVCENTTAVQIVPPRFIRPLQSSKATEGSCFQFSCTVSGNPLPTVSWYKNDKCIDDSPDYIINYNNGESTLLFEEIFLEDDAVYTCSASNPAGIEHCSASLLVEPLEPTEIPHFKIPLTNAMARVGQKAKLEALVGGIPQPDIYWTHNGKPYHPRHLKYENGRVTLLISQVYPNDSGLYVLTAKNLAGEAYSNCNLIVKGRLPNETSDSEMASDMEPVKPSVQLSLKDISIFEGKPVRLDCVIVGQPEPEVIWYHNERPIKESADIQLLFQGDRCSLIIREVYQEDAGTYKVVAINSAGEASSSCELKVTPLNLAEPATRANAERLNLLQETMPKFEKFLSDVLVDEGQTVELEVNVSGDQPLSAKWYLSNKEMLPNDRVSIHSDAATGVFKLIMQNVNGDDKGVYTVKVSNNVGDAKCFSHLIVKSVNVPAELQRSQQNLEIVEKHVCPEFKEIFSDQNAHPDESIKFECIARGKPTPKVRWYFNDSPVSGSNFLVSTSGDRQVLNIQKANVDTVGKISCIAENDVGKAECMAFLNLIGPGVQATMPGKSEQQIVTQEHNTDSSRVTIRKQTFTTTSTSQLNTYEGNAPQTEVHHSTAHIEQNPKLMESVLYRTVQETNGNAALPTIQQKSFVLVKSPSSDVTPVQATPASPTRVRKQIAPRFSTPLTGKIVDQGADVHLEAIYDGFPSPEIKVEKNGELLFESERRRINVKCNRVTINLDNVTPVDTGRYAVTATNILGKSTCTADVVVKKSIFPPVFGRRLQAQVVKRGEKIMMEVEVTGMPEPTVTWLKDEKPLEQASISEHRLLTQGNTYKLIIEKGQTSDSGRYTVKATNAGGEAKSIADCTILEPSPERLHEIVKTIVYEQPTSLRTEPTFAKEPLSFEVQKSDANTETDLHSISESTIVTEHRCTTEATMRLEHKNVHFDLSTEIPQRSKTLDTAKPQTATIPIIENNEADKITDTTTIESKIIPIIVQPPMAPSVLPKPHQPVFGSVCLPSKPQDLPLTKTTQVDVEITTNNTARELPLMTKTTNTGISRKFTHEHLEKLAETLKRGKSPISSHPQADIVLNTNLEQEKPNFDLIPGSPPEICYTPKFESQNTQKVIDTSETFKLEKQSLAPHTLPITTPSTIMPTAPITSSMTHTSSMSKTVKVEFTQPVNIPNANLVSPVQQANRPTSPKPSAEGIAMSKLWTPTNAANVSGYESSSDFESKQILKTPPPTKIEVPRRSSLITELKAPQIVKQVSQSLNLPHPTAANITKIPLRPGTPPEICFTPQTTEVRRHSMVETMERTLEHNLMQGPSKVLPMSVPTLTPNTTAYKPPPPVVPVKLNTDCEYYESDYDSDRWKYSGSESEGPTNAQHTKLTETPIGLSGSNYNYVKTSGYAADTEEITNYRKMESLHESRSSTYYEPNMQPPPQPQPLSQPQPKPQQQDDRIYTSMTSNVTFNKFSNNDNVKPAPKIETYLNQAPIAAARFTPCKITEECSDYSSEVDERFRSISRTCDSDVDIKGYRVVFPPTPTPKSMQTNGHKSPVVIVTPSPMEFEPTPMTANVISSAPRQKFEPIQKEIRHEFKMEQQHKMEQQFQKQNVVKPKPIAAKFLAAAAATQIPPQQPHAQQPQPQPQPQLPPQQSFKSQPTIYYNAISGTPVHTARMATETKNVMQMKESTETCQRFVNMEQTKRIIHFDHEKERQEFEPFTYKAGGRACSTPRRDLHTPQIPIPTKFVPGDFRESDYESEIENARIRPLWTPCPSEHNPLGYRHVEPPRPGRSCSLPRTYERVLSPMEFDHGPKMPKKIQMDVESLRRERELQNRTQSLNRFSSVRTSYNEQREQEHKQQTESSTITFPRDDMNLKIGSPPKYGYIQAQADNEARRMSSTFMQKSHKFVSDIRSDFRKSTTISNGAAEPRLTYSPQIRPGFKRAPSEGDNLPQAYRDDTRASQFGTKCVDPDTGLIYFKYDFGYEFGILFPGEGKKFVGRQWNNTGSGNSLGGNTAGRKSPYPLKINDGNELIIPVQHERTLSPAGRNTRSLTKKPFTTRPLSVGLNPSVSGFYSDTDSVTRRGSTSDTFGVMGAKKDMKKRYSLPSTKNIDIFIDRLHNNEPNLQHANIGSKYANSVPELPTNVPVNAHLVREEQLPKTPMFITPLKDIAVVSGQTARFECIVQGFPQPSINWSHDNVQVSPDNHHITEYRNGVCRLTMPHTFLDNSGVYYCTATNPLGTATTSGQLTVQNRTGRI